jgi:hypothetical protein
MVRTGGHARASREALDRFEVGMTVSDLEQSRIFYRDFLAFRNRNRSAAIY